MLKVRLLEDATASSLALARIWVFIIWAVYLLVDPVQRLTLLPIELFHTHSLFSFVPHDVWAALITPAGLLGLVTVLLVAVAWAAVGMPGARLATAVVVVLGLTYLQVKKGFGGHWDHREMSLLYITAALLISPAWDAFAVRKDPRARSRRPGAYRAALLVACFVIVLQYVFIGAARLFIGGPGVFMNGTLQAWVENRNLRPNPFGFDLGTYFLDPVWSVPLDLLFLGGTLLEVVVLVLLFLPRSWLWAKILLVAGFVVFHGSIFVLMNVPFPEDVALLLLFFNLAAPLDRLRRTHATPGTLRFDRNSPRACDIAETAGRHAPSVTVVAEASVDGGLAFDADGVGVTGEQAYTEVLYRSPGRLLRAWWRDHISRRRGPLPTDRSPLAAWFVGTLAEEQRERV